MIDAHRSNVIGFFDTHPINEDEILAKLAARGANLGALTEDGLRARQGVIDAITRNCYVIYAKCLNFKHRVNSRPRQF